VDTERYRPECETEWFRNEFEVADGQPTVGMVAQFIERKGHRTLLQALPRILETAPGLRVLLFGQGPLRKELEAQVRDAGMEETVRFAGFRDDLERVLNYFRRQPMEGKYVILETQKFDEFYIGQLTGIRGDKPEKLTDPLSSIDEADGLPYPLESVEQAEHAVFLKRIDDLRKEMQES